MHRQDLVHIRRLFVQYTLRNWGALLAALAGATVLVVAEASVPYFAGRLIEVLTEDPRWPAVLQAGATLMGLLLVSALSFYVYAATANLVMARVVAGIRVAAFSRLQHARRAQSDSGDHIARLLDDVVEMHVLITRVPISILLNLCLLVLITVILGRLLPAFAVAVAIALPVYVVLGRQVTARLSAINKQVLEARGNMAALMEESLQLRTLTLSYNLQAWWTERFAHIARQFLKLRVQLGNWQSMAQAAAYFLRHALPASMLLLGARSVLNGQLSVGSLLAAFWYTNRLFIPIDFLLQAVLETSQALPALRRVVEVLETEQEPDHGHELKVTRGEIELRGVSFAYSPETPVHRNLWLKFTRGAINVVVGPNGVGKSTLIALLLRILEPQEGSIVVDGQDLSTVRPSSVRAAMAVVTQQVQLVSGTVLDNVRLGQLALSEKEVQDRAEALGLSDLLGELPQGWFTPVGKNGELLSGGQAQRIAFARALLRDAPILLVDEGTAHMDAESERRVYQMLARWAEHKTVVVITHRPAAVPAPHRIFFLDPALVRAGDAGEAG